MSEIMKIIDEIKRQKAKHHWSKRTYFWYRKLEILNNKTKLETSTEKQLSVSKRSCDFLSKAVKRVDKFQQTCQQETLRDLDLGSEISFAATNDTSC